MTEPDERHRGVSYTIPSHFRQFLIAYRTQMRLYMRGITLIIILALIVLIPVIKLSGIMSLMVETQGTDNPNTMLALYLALSPMITAIVVPLVIAELIPSEFKDRSAYLNFALPQSRSTLYYGKFCAGMTVLVAMYLLAYGVTIMINMISSGSADAGRIWESLAMALCGAFACASTVYFISLLLQKKTTIICMLVWFIGLPGIALLFYVGNKGLSDSFGYLPFFLTDYSLYALEPNLSTMSVINWFVEKPLLYPNSTVACIIALVWGLAFILVGQFIFSRRQL